MVKKKKEDEVERNVNLTKYIAAIAVTALIFILGISVGTKIAESKIGEMQDTQQKLTTMLSGLELKNQLLEQTDICQLTWTEIWKEKVDMGNKIGSLEYRYGKENEDVMLQKEIYELIEIRTYLLLEKLNNECQRNLTQILFFYTNDKNQNWVENENQGIILDSLYKKNPNINIFCFEMNIKNPATDSLRQMYDVKTTPTIVIDEKIKLEGLQTLEEINKYIKQ